MRMNLIRSGNDISRALLRSREGSMAAMSEPDDCGSILGIGAVSNSRSSRALEDTSQTRLQAFTVLATVEAMSALEDKHADRLDELDTWRLVFWIGIATAQHASYKKDTWCVSQLLAGPRQPSLRSIQIKPPSLPDYHSTAKH